MKKIDFKKFILVFAILILVFNLTILAISLDKNHVFDFNKFTAKGTEASISYCIKNSNIMQDTAETCGDNLTLHTNQSFYCELNFTVSNPNDIFVSSYFLSSPELFEVNNSNRSINFTANSSTWGNHSSIIFINDSSCGTHALYHFPYNFTVNFNNTSPRYHSLLPNITMEQETIAIPYSLDDYFRDIDGDELSYEVLSYDINALTVIIYSDTNEVKIEGKEGICGDYTITFLADDGRDGIEITSPPANVHIECNNPEEQSSGGGGGGGMFYEDCEEDWTCLEWSDCYPPSSLMADYEAGYQKQSCYDKNSCDSDNYKETRYRECTYLYPVDCYPEWECTDWTPCRKDGTRERNCFDINECPSEDQIRFGIPEIKDFCVYSETCSDGIKNNNELGVDCGGPCEPCKIIESPSIIFDSNKILSWFIGILVAIAVIILIIYRIFRKQIKMFVSRIVWLLVRKAARQIYLGGKEKEKILGKLKDYEKNLLSKIKKDKLSNSELNKLESNLFIIFRKVFGEMLRVPFESSKQEFITKINKLETTEEFRDITLNLLERITNLEKQGRKEVDGRKEIFSDIDEIILDFNTIKFFTFNISDKINLNDFKDIKLKTKKSKNKLFEIIENVNKSYVYLQHLNIKEAKNTYLNMIGTYESFKEEDKTKIYELTSTLFKILKYVSSHINS